MIGLNKAVGLIKSHFKLVAVFVILISVAFVFLNSGKEVVLSDYSSLPTVSGGISSNIIVNNSSGVHVECRVDSDCDDGNQCTFNLCDEGKCVNNVNVWGECVLSDGKKGTCNEMAECVLMESHCDNGVDDDGDGLIDCEEQECEGLPCDLNGSPGVCTDGVCVPFV